MLADSTLIAFLPTRDLERALGFFAHTLGLRLISSDPFALVFDTNGTRLRVTAVSGLTPAPYTVAGWTVADMARTVASLGTHGVTFERFAGMEQDGLGVWTTPDGAKVAWFKDPDGNTLSLIQD